MCIGADNLRKAHELISLAPLDRTIEQDPDIPPPRVSRCSDKNVAGLLELQAHDISTVEHPSGFRCIHVVHRQQRLRRDILDKPIRALVIYDIDKERRCPTPHHRVSVHLGIHDLLKHGRALGILPHDCNQSRFRAELLQSDRLIGSLAAKDLNPFVYRDAASGVRNGPDREHHVTTCLPDHNDMRTSGPIRVSSGVEWLERTVCVPFDACPSFHASSIAREGTQRKGRLPG